MGPVPPVGEYATPLGMGWYDETMPSRSPSTTARKSGRTLSETSTSILENTGWLTSRLPMLPLLKSKHPVLCLSFEQPWPSLLEWLELAG